MDARLNSQGLVQLIGELLNQRTYQNPPALPGLKPQPQLVMWRLTAPPVENDLAARPSAQALPAELAQVVAMSRQIIREINRLHALGTALPAALYRQYILQGIDKQLASFMEGCKQSLASTAAAKYAQQSRWTGMRQDIGRIGSDELYVLAAQFMTAAKTALAPSLKTRYVQMSAELTALANAHLH